MENNTTYMKEKIVKMIRLSVFILNSLKFYYLIVMHL